jgi:hypothetical protein
LGINESTRMSLWMLRIGIALAVVGLVLLSPLGDLLPVNFWPSLKSLFKSGYLPADPVFYRVVPGEQSRVVEFALIGLGLALVCASLYVRNRK